MTTKTIIGAELEPTTIERIVADANTIIDRSHENKKQNVINEELYQQINLIWSKLTILNATAFPQTITAGEQSTITIDVTTEIIANGVTIYRDGFEVYRDNTQNTHWQYQDNILPGQSEDIHYTVETTISGATKTKDLFVTITKQPSGIEFTNKTAVAIIGEENQYPMLINENQLECQFTSSNQQVATVDNLGNITLFSAGTTTITATTEGSSIYAPGSDYYVLTVVQKPATNNVLVGFGDDDYYTAILRDTQRQLSNNMIERIDIARDNSYIFIAVDKHQFVDNLYTYPGPGAEYWELPILIREIGVYGDYRYYRSINTYDASGFEYKINKTQTD